MKIVLILSQIISPQQRMIEMGTRLAKAGHKITVLTPVNGLALAQHAGFEAVQIPDPMINTFIPVLPRPTGLRTPGLSRKRKAQAATAMRTGGLTQHLATLSPDLVLINAELLPHAVTARGAGYATALVASMFVTPPGLQAPPLHYNQTPGVGLTGSKTAVGAAWVRYLARKSALVARNALRDWGADHPSALRQLEKHHNVKLRRRFWGWQMPFTYDLPMLVMLPAALNLPVDPYPNQQFIGPMILQNRPTRAWDSTCLDRFAKGKHRIMMAFGTLVRPGGPLIRAVLDAARQNTDWEVLGLLRHADDITDLPPNVTLVPWAPQREVLRHADLAIIHAGAASVSECIEAEVPMLVYPKATDQCGNAARVVFHGLGRQGGSADGSAQITAHIAALRADTALPPRMAAMKHACAAEEAAGLLETAVLDLAKRQKR